MAEGSEELLVAVSYSLPHVISASAGVIVAGYLGLLYINTYKWDSKVFGTVYSIYFMSISICQFVFSLILQFVVTTPDEVIGLRNCKIAQVSNIAIHSISFFFLLFLPMLKLKHDAKRTDLQSMLEAASTNSGLNNFDSKNQMERQKPTLLSRLLESKYFYYLIYFFAILHGYGWGAYEICDRLLPTYMIKDSTYISSINDAIRGFFICAIPLVVLVYNKFVGNKRPDYTIHLAIATVLLIILIPVCVVFFVYTHSPGGSGPIDIVPETANLDYPVLFGLTVLEIMPGVFYLTCPIIVQYISTHILNDDADFRNYATALFMTFFFIGSVLYRAFSGVVTLYKKGVSYLCVASFTIAYLLFYPHKFSWNKKGYTYYVVICVFNVFIMIFFINTNIMITNQLADDNHKKYRWLIQGIIYVVKNFFISLLMKLVYNTYDREKLPSREGASEGQSTSVKGQPNVNLEVGGNSLLDRLKAWFNFRNLFIVVFLVSQVLSVLSTMLYKEHVYD